MFAKTLPYFALLQFFFGLFGSVHAQTNQKQQKSAWLTIYPIEAQQRIDSLIIIHQEPISALSFASPDLFDLKSIQVWVNDAPISLGWDEHDSGNDKIYYTNLHFVSAPQARIKLVGSFPSLVLHAIKAQYAIQQKATEDQNFSCEEPESVAQAQWRAGLPDPNYQRQFTHVRHGIIHHSATSSSHQNYTEMVRSIYIFHTQSRGWSDIGYNYLVAPNGIIYKGRDPLDGSQSDVLGAHFCGSNSGTMGVCLLGNYDVEQPQDPMIRSLEALMAWKVEREGLQALGQNPHPLNSALGVIAGHRDGCSTACPGQNVYARMADIRQAVATAIERCQEVPEVPALAVNIYPNPVVDGFVMLERQEEWGNLLWIELITMDGKKQRPELIIKERLSLKLTFPFSTKGIYLLNARFENQHVQHRLVFL
jgi:hypothetical protein